MAFKLASVATEGGARINVRPAAEVGAGLPLLPKSKSGVLSMVMIEGDILGVMFLAYSGRNDRG